MSTTASLEKVTTLVVRTVPQNEALPLRNIEVVDGLKSYQELVGGYVEVVRLPHLKTGRKAPIVMVVNEEGVLRGLSPNRRASVIAHRLIVGDVFLVREDIDHFVDYISR